jgi:hypothetical protein
MATVMDCGARVAVGRGRPGRTRPSRLALTLVDLITAIQDVVGPEDDALVVATVRDLLRSGQLTGLGKRGVRPPSAVARGWLCGRSPSRRRSRGATGPLEVQAFTDVGEARVAP